MIKNSTYFFLFWTIFSVVTQTQAQDIGNKNLMDSIVVETTDGKLIHLKVTTPNKNKLTKQLPNLHPKILAEVYKLTNLTPHRAFVRYSNKDPFLQKGYELKSGKCLYIHSSYFDHLSILWRSQLLCGSEEGHYNPPCQPMDYALVLLPQQRVTMNLLLESTLLKGYHEFSYINTVYDERLTDLILLHKDIYSTKQCELF